MIIVTEFVHVTKDTTCNSDTGTDINRQEIFSSLPKSPLQFHSLMSNLPRAENIIAKNSDFVGSDALWSCTMVTRRELLSSRSESRSLETRARYERSAFLREGKGRGNTQSHRYTERRTIKIHYVTRRPKRKQAIVNTEYMVTSSPFGITPKFSMVSK